MAEGRYKKCDCEWRSKCEWRFGVCGEFATTSEWMPDYETGRWIPRWLCDDHLGHWRGRKVFLHGIHRPKDADEFWRPSIIHHIRMYTMINRAELEKAAPVRRMTDESHQPLSGYIASHQRHWTPAQWATHARYLEALKKIINGLVTHFKILGSLIAKALCVEPNLFVISCLLISLKLSRSIKTCRQRFNASVAPRLSFLKAD